VLHERHVLVQAHADLRGKLLLLGDMQTLREALTHREELTHEKGFHAHTVFSLTLLSVFSLMHRASTQPSNSAIVELMAIMQLCNLLNHPLPYLT
jgi:hypothetical protein